MSESLRDWSVMAKAPFDPKILVTAAAYLSNHELVKQGHDIWLTINTSCCFICSFPLPCSRCLTWMASSQFQENLILDYERPHEI